MAFHTPGTGFESDHWELYNVEEDFTETADLASQHPEKLKELQDLWWAEAERNGALPQLEAIPMRQRTYNQILADPVP